MKTLHDWRATSTPDSGQFPVKFKEMAEAVEQDERDHLTNHVSEETRKSRSLMVEAMRHMFETWVVEIGCTASDDPKAQE